MKCQLVRNPDITRCEACGLEWDTNAKREPDCPAHRNAAIIAYADMIGELEILRNRYRVLEFSAQVLAGLVLLFAFAALACAP